jgi:hypothetical protein
MVEIYSRECAPQQKLRSIVTPIAPRLAQAQPSDLGSQVKPRATRPDDASSTPLAFLSGLIVLQAIDAAAIVAKGSETDGVTAPGNVAVEMQWPDKLDADVDLWVQAPGDAPVGYSNKSGRVFNLLRDDLGKAQDMTYGNSFVN